MKCGCGKVMRLGGTKPAPKPQPVQPVTPKASPKPKPTSKPKPQKAQPVQPVAPAAKPVQPVAPQPVQPVAPQPVQPVQPQAAPVQAQPVAPVPIQPLAPINEVPDPIFGTGQKIQPEPGADLMGIGDINSPPAAGGQDNLFGSMEPPAAANPYETAYAPPAPITRPNRPRKTRRRSQQSSVGPIMSIISGALGTFYGLGCLFFFGAQMLVFVTAIAGAEVSPPPQALFVGIVAIILLLLSIAMTGGSGYSGVTGILELLNEYRNPGPSQIAGTACISFTALVLIGFVIAIVMAIALQTNVGQVQFDGASVVGMVIGFIIGFIILLLFLAIPIFVFFVGHFRNR